VRKYDPVRLILLYSETVVKPGHICLTAINPFPVGSDFLKNLNDFCKTLPEL
jgi:hypothetical protein